MRPAAWAPLLIMGGAFTQYLGAALAVQVFDALGAPAVAWLRVAWSALFLLAWRRPSWRRFDRAQRWTLARFGLALAAMNLAFYLAIDRLPLGTAVAIEFSGPITVAALGSRHRRDLLAVGLAAVGVVLLADVQWQANAAGVGYALLAATLWAGYIVWGSRVGAAGAASGLDALSLSTAIGALLVAPIGVAGLVAAGPSATVLAGSALLCAVVGLCSNVVPYALDQVVLARLDAARFALLSTLLPVTALAVGATLLGQRPHALELLGVALVVAALALRAGTDRRR